MTLPGLDVAHATRGSHCCRPVPVVGVSEHSVAQTAREL